MTRPNDRPDARPLPRPDDLHDATQAARVLGIPAARIRAWARAEKIPIHDSLPAAGRRGRVQLYRLADIEPLAEAYRARHGAPPDTEEPTCQP